MKRNNYGFIGLGLIGGSLAKSLKKKDPSCRICAYTRTRHTSRTALEQGLSTPSANLPTTGSLKPAATFSCVPRWEII